MIPLAPHNPKDHPNTPVEKLSLLILKKPYIQHIFYIEPHLVRIKDPLALAVEVLPPDWHFLLKAPKKSIKFYKIILIQEKSTRIENIPSKGDPSVILYHKLIITRIIYCKE